MMSKCDCQKDDVFSQIMPCGFVVFEELLSIMALVEKRKRRTVENAVVEPVSKNSRGRF